MDPPVVDPMKEINECMWSFSIPFNQQEIDGDVDAMMTSMSTVLLWKNDAPSANAYDYLFGNIYESNW